MKLLEATNTIEASIQDIDRMWALVESQHPELFSQLRELRLILRSLIGGGIKQPHYGWNDKALRELLPSVPENINDIIEVLVNLISPKLAALFEDADSVTIESVAEGGRTKGDERNILKQTLSAIRSLFQRENNHPSVMPSKTYPLTG